MHGLPGSDDPRKTSELEPDAPAPAAGLLARHVSAELGDSTKGRRTEAFRALHQANTGGGRAPGSLRLSELEADLGEELGRSYLPCRACPRPAGGGDLFDPALHVRQVGGRELRPLRHGGKAKAARQAATAERISHRHANLGTFAHSVRLYA